ncbi:MAG: class I SAM-dependent methyltransferase [Candidatus Kuenenia stuttgartiensis]|nr:class I SAM-dependent methyltransferase [Candidatus Kuenenia stuttgartiensis]
MIFIKRLRLIIFRISTSKYIWNIFEYIYLKLCCDEFKYPPRHIRSIVGGPSIREYASVGMEFTIYLKLLCSLKPYHHVLEIGCGCGRIAQNLIDYIDEGSYEGIDVNKKVIQYAKKIEQEHRKFKFHHINVYSGSYNSESNVMPSDFRFPYRDNNFDIVFASSVFTHMTPPGLRNYICEIYRVLKPNGILMSTFHLTKDLTQLVTNYVDVRPDSVDSKYYKVADVNIPEINVAYDENYILNLFKNDNLSLIGAPYFGKWNNRENHLSWQDILLLKKVPLK